MNNKGSALILAYAVILVLTFLGAAVIQQSISESAQVTGFVNSMRAFWLAEAGVQRGFWELNYGSGAGTYQETETGIGDFDVSMVNTGVGEYTITATGSVPDRTSPATARGVAIDVSKVYIPIFRYGAFGKTSVSLTNSAVVDSYDSDVDVYDPLNPGTNGDVGTNGTTVGAISLSNSSTIKGDANTGPNGTVTLINESTVTGVTDDTCNEAYPAVEVPQELQDLSSEGNLVLANEATRDIAGDHQYISISLSNSAQVNVTGNTRIYLTSFSDALKLVNSTKLNIAEGSSLTIYTQGKVSVANSATINNVVQKPSKFILYSSHSGSGGIAFSNSGSMYGAIYAPGTSVALANSFQIYGSVIGNTITMPNSSKIHYDEALGRLMSASVPSGEYSINSWSESNP